MSRFLGLASGLALIIAISGCEPSQVVQPDKYGVMTDSYMSRSLLRSVSPLVVIDETGELDVCVSITGTAAAPGDYEERIQRAVQNAADSWNAMLNEPAPRDADGYVFPDWRRASVRINFTCSGSNLYNFEGNTSNGRAYADVVNQRVVLDNNCTFDEGHLRNVVAHEYGHLLGLSDTYVEPEIGLDVYGQPDSMMQSAHGFTADDQAGVWNLWRYIEFGGDPCGPGYDVQAVNRWGTYCILSDDDGEGESDSDDSDDSGCTYLCADYDIAIGQCVEAADGALWECDSDGCLNRVYSCSDDSEDPTCDIFCSWYDLEPGDCAIDTDDNYWECDADGCLGRVDVCGRDTDDSDSDDGDSDDSDSDDSDSGVSCRYDCADWDQTPGDCFTDSAGNSWECNVEGCLEWTESCAVEEEEEEEEDSGPSCDYDCADWGQSPGDCFTDSANNSWQCDADGCLQWTESCGASSCRYECSLLGLTRGQCSIDGGGNSWYCDDSSCLQWVSSCW